MINKNDFRYFDKARHAAMISDFNKTHIGCIAVYKDNIIGVGCNLEKTHPMQKYYNKYRMHPQKFYYSPKIHVEINCLNSIRNLDINFSKVRLYIYRIRKDQDYGMSRPCPSCMAAIKDMGIKHIYYTTNDGFVYENLAQIVKDNKLIMEEIYAV